MALSTCPRWRYPVGAGAYRDMMARMMRRIIPVVAIVCLAGWRATLLGQDKVHNKPGEWTTYGGDLASTRYSPLDQISKDNFRTLEVAWRFKTDSLGPRPEF